MGTSYTYYKTDVRNYVINNFKEEVEILDVGAGCGTYYDLLGEYFRNIDGVEAYAPNIERYRLESKYRHIYNKDIRDFEYAYYDIVIFGDVLEHLEVKEAQKVLKYAIEHSIEVIVAVPYMYEQGIVEGNVYEIHKQPDLTPENVLERYPELELLFGNEEYGYYVRKRGRIN